MKLRIALTLAVLLTFAVSTLYAQNERQYIRDSYKQYNDSDYAAAQESSAKAMVEAPNSYEANYNYANSLFKQQKVDEAIEKYEQMAASETDKQHLAELYHNLGDCHYMKGEFDKSVDYFKKSLRADPTNDNTRYNLVAAKKMLDNPPPDQNQQQQQQQQEQQEEKQEKQQEQQPQDQQDQQQNQGQQEQQEMSREEAERLLEAVQSDEDQLQEERKKMKAVTNKKIEKNW